MYFQLISILLFTTVSAFPTSQDEVVNPSIETLNNGVKILKLRASKEDIELRLYPAGQVISDDFVELEAGVPIHPSENINDLKRKLYRNAESNTALHIDEDGPLTIHGRINYELLIEPYKSKRSEGGKIPHRLLAISSRKSSYFNDVVIPSEVKSHAYQRITHASSKQCIVINYKFVVDSTMEDVEDNKLLRDKLSLILIETQNIYDNSGFNFKLKMLGFDAYKEGSEPDYITQSFIPDKKNLYNLDNLLANMSSYFEHNRSEMVEKASVIFLVTRRVLGHIKEDGTIFEGAIGIAYLGNACHEYKKVGAMVYFPGKMNGDTLAHETAHLLGSPHDGEGPQNSVPDSPGSIDCPGSLGYLMGDMSGPNRNIFSPCTQKNIKNFLWLSRAECLYENCN